VLLLEESPDFVGDTAIKREHVLITLFDSCIIGDNHRAGYVSDESAPDRKANVGDAFPTDRRVLRCFKHDNLDPLWHRSKLLEVLSEEVRQNQPGTGVLWINHSIDELFFGLSFGRCRRVRACDSLPRSYFSGLGTDGNVRSPVAGHGSNGVTSLDIGLGEYLGVGSVALDNHRGVTLAYFLDALRVRFDNERRVPVFFHEIRNLEPDPTAARNNDPIIE